jgi:Ca2+-binding RTX toxin-like protein
MRRAIPITALLALAALPAPASAHSIMGRDGDTLVYSSRDATSQNTLTVVVTGDRVRFRDPTVDGGIDPTTVCDPGEVDRNGYVIEVVCRREGLARLRIDVADREDSVSVGEAAGAAPLAAVVLGGAGADTLAGGGAGDQLDGGSGADALDGRGGDDELFARDDAGDRVSCGDGSDRAEADGADAVDATCEAVDRSGAPPPGLANDTVPPRVEGGAFTFQRLRRSRNLRVMATASEAADLAASGTLAVGPRRFPLIAPRVRVAVAGGGATLRLRLSRAAWRALRRAGRGRAVVVVVATDAAGNSSATRLPSIRLAA